MATITANLNGGDTITPDADLTFKVYGLIDNYTTAIATVGSANTDENVSVNAGVVTIENVDLGLETFVKVTSIDEAGNESNQSTAFEVPDLTATFYVRPAGTTYGNGDGKSYANAWSGASEFNSKQVTNSIVYVCGTFEQDSFVVDANNITLRGDYDGDPGVIDGEDNGGLGVTMDGLTGVKIYSLRIINHLSANLQLNGDCEIQTFNIDVSGSGDQGVQHFENTVAIHNNLSGDNCFDEVISGHQSAQITLNGGSLTNSNSGINAVGDGLITVNGTTFSGNVYDLNIPSEGLSCVANSCTFASKLRCDRNSTLTLNNCDGNQDIELGNVLGGSLIINNSLIGEIKSLGSINSEISCQITNSVFEIQGNYKNGLTITESKVGVTAQIQGNVTLSRNLLISTETTNNTFRIESGHQITANYNVCILSDSTNRFFNLLNTDNTIDNNTFIGTNGNGRAIIKSSAGTNVYNNNIFLDLQIGIQSFSAQNTLNNCVRFNVSNLQTNNITSNNEITTNPDLEDISNNDFALKVGSPAIGAGVTVSNATGISSATWTGALPNVVTKEQIAPFDIGAYVS